MFEKATSGRDAFTFSLRGMTTVASYAIATAVADDRINKAWDERLKRAQEQTPAAAGERGGTFGRFWLYRRLRTA